MRNTTQLSDTATATGFIPIRRAVKLLYDVDALWTFLGALRNCERDGRDGRDNEG